MKYFLFLLVAFPLLASAAAAHLERYDESINPRHLWRPFTQVSGVYTSDFDVLKRVKISCASFTAQEKHVPGFMLDTDNATVSYPGEFSPIGEHPAEYLRNLNCAYENFPAKGHPASYRCNERHNVEYLNMSFLSLAAPAPPRPRPVTYVRIGPMPMTPVASSKLQCRWLRNFDQRTHTYPTAGLYCAGGPFIWNHQEAGEKFVGDVTKMHLFFPVMGADYLSYGQLNSFQARKIDAEGVTHKEWSYLAGENRYSMVLQALKQSPLQRKNYKFSYRTSYGSSCEVEFENTYQGQ